MAVINPTVESAGVKDGSVKKFVYEALTTTNDNGAPMKFSEWADRTIQVVGTFGAGGNLQWQGSNDGGVTWAPLTDPQGNALDITTAKIETIMEITELARPLLTAGDGTTDLDVFVLVRRPNNMRT